MTYKKEQLHRALALFVGTDNNRPTLTRVFKQESYYFATDAHSLMGVSTSIDLGYDYYEKSPNAIAIIPKERIAPVTFNILEIEKQIIELTPLVQETTKCLQCEGAGKEECNLGHDHDCEECDGKGRVDTFEEKLVPDNTVNYLIEDCRFTFAHLNRLVQACKLLGIETIDKVAGNNKRHACLFETDNIIFLVMQIPYPEDEVFINLKN